MKKTWTEEAWEDYLNLQNDKVDYAIVLNQTSFDKFISKVKKNGTIIVNSSLAEINKKRNALSGVSFLFLTFPR